jgi:hypothetical protein
VTHVIKAITQLKLDLAEHLKLRRKGNAVQLIWETKSDTTLLSEVCITDVPNQLKGDLYNAKN